jgi:acyl-coenzyme A synthetase/AMP-(fatty) acid ligase
VEEVHTAFDGVVESRVLGRAHAEVGAVPVAELVMAPGLPLPPPQALMAHCRQQLARFKVPVEYRLVTGVPRTASGKIKRC